MSEAKSGEESGARREATSGILLVIVVSDLLLLLRSSSNLTSGMSPSTPTVESMSSKVILTRLPWEKRWEGEERGEGRGQSKVGWEKGRNEHTHLGSTYSPAIRVLSIIGIAVIYRDLVDAIKLLEDLFQVLLIRRDGNVR